MSKMRVHELAKELNKTSKELMEILEKNQIEVKSHQSVLEEEQVQKVKASLAPKRKKRKNIIQVFNPQNSRMSGGPDERLRRERKPRPARDAQGNPVRRPRPEGAHAVKKPNPESMPAGTAEQKHTAAGKTSAAGMAPAAETKPVEKAAAMEKKADAVQTQKTVNVQAEPVKKAAETVKAQETVKAPETVKAQETVKTPGTVKGQETVKAQETVKVQPQAVKAEKKPQPEREQHQENRNAENRGGRENRGEGRDSRPTGRGNNGSRDNRGEGRSFGGNRENRGEGRNFGGNRDNRDNRGGANGGRDNRGEGRSFGGNRDNRGEGRSFGGNRDNRDNRSGDNRGGANSGRDNRGEGRSFGGNRDNRGEGRGFGGGRDNRGSDNRGGGRSDNRGGRRLAMPERPTEAIERQTQKNERQNDRNNKRSDKRNDRDRFDKKQSKAGTRNLQKQVNKPVKPQPKPQEPKEEVIKTITLPDMMTIRELADMMKVQPSVIVKKLFLQGTVVTVNQEIDFDKAEEIALEFNCIAEHEEKVDVIAELLKEEEEDEKDMVPRVPVVCVMGHVDHGKTSLLDAIRDTHVTDREAGGITQHIGASVVTCNGQKITFLDTPGHEAFTAMRMRGANSTDIAVLVVAADDGVMPQTVEAISHAKAAGVEIIVAINKIDKPSANVEKVKQELTEYELVPEDWGGSTIFVPVSAHTHEGIDQLLEMILLTAEVMELKANPKRQARGLVIEGKLDKGKGPVANVLVQKGTLHVGDFIAAGACSGRVRAMMDDKGRRVKEAGPSMPVEVLGFNDVPGAGEIFVAPETDKEAKSFAETFVSEGRERLLEETRHRMSLDDLFSQIQAGNLKELNLIVKADVQGSVEAVKASLQKLSNEEVVVKIIHGGVGAINESDVVLASASNAIIIGFNVRPDAVAKATAEREGVDLRLYKVIYNAIEDVEAAMKGMLDPVFEEKIIGHAEVRQLFKASGVGTIAGSYVLDGVFQRGCSIRIKRGDDMIFEGALASLKRFKDDVKEVKAGYECGLVVEKFNDIQEGDIYEAYTMVEVPR